MRPTLWLDVKRILGDALDVPRERREEYVRAVAGNTAVCDEVLRLLAARDRAAQATIVARPGSEAPTETSGAADHGAAAAAVTELAPGALVAGRYLLGARLGVGAFGAVHRATDRVSGDVVAVKIVVGGPGEADLLRREISVLRRSRLPGVVELLDEGIEDHWAYIVMRLVDGAAFPGEMPAGPVVWKDLEPRALAVVETLGRLHWLGVLHRDVKPDNVLVGADGRVTVVDLGVAHDLSGLADHWQDGIVGTPVYLAPERFLGGPATVAGDLYALGVMLYESLTRRPFRDVRSLGDLVMLSSKIPPPIRASVPGLPAHVADAIDALVHPEPSCRPPSARVLAAMLRGRGAAGARVRLPQLGHAIAVAEEDLRPLFAGHDRLFHIREDGARELWRRTLGRPGEVAREIETWVEAGIARWEEERIVIDRAGIERLESRVGSMLPHAVVVPEDLTPTDYDAAAVLELATYSLPLATVARALERGVAEIEAAVARLAEHGLVRRDALGAAEALLSIDAAAEWTATQRRAVHAVIARTLPAASERRLFHLLAADAVDEIPAEAVAVGRRLHRDGRLDAAILTASSGLTAARAARVSPAIIDELLLLVVEAAIGSSTVDAIDRAAVELGRAPHDTPTRRTLLRACTGGRLVLVGSPERALVETEPDEPLAANGALRLRQIVRSFAARFVGDPDLARRVLAESYAWSRRSDRRLGLANIRGLLGWRRYHQGRFESAAWLHVRCAAAQRAARARITALTDAASAFLEAGELGAAVDHAARAAALAAEHRLATHEARAIWVGRSAAYRSGTSPEPDPELVAALEDGIAPAIAAVGLLVEGAILLRAGDRGAASAAAHASARLARRANHASGEALALGLAASVDGQLDDAEFERFVAQGSRVAVDAVRCQALALVLGAVPGAAPRLPESLLRTVRLRPRAERSDCRCEVLSEVEWSEILERVPGVTREGGSDGEGI